MTDRPTAPAEPNPARSDAGLRPPRSLKWLLWRLVRPVARPIAWRLRTFLIGPVRGDVAELRAEIADLRAQVERMAAEATGPALDRRVLQVMEQALLTIALDREGK